MQLFSAEAHKKLKKPPSKVAQKNSNPLFFPYCPELPKQKNLCSKMWPIDQLYIKLGSALYVFHTHLMFFSFYIRNLKLSIDFFKKAAEFFYEFLNGQDFLL